MRKIGPAGWHSGCGHAVHVAAEVRGRRRAVMARVICRRRLFDGMIAVSVIVVVVFDLLQRFGLRGMHRRLGHCDHAGLKRGNDEHGDGEKRANDRPPHSAMPDRILHTFTSAICCIRKSSINGRMRAKMRKRDHSQFYRAALLATCRRLSQRAIGGITIHWRSGLNPVPNGGTSGIRSEYVQRWVTWV